jgi:hypothetical protein
MKSAAECHSRPKVVAGVAKSRPEGALPVVVVVKPCSPAAPGIDTS